MSLAARLSSCPSVRRRIGPDDAQVNRITFLLAGVQSPSLGRFGSSSPPLFWINNAPKKRCESTVFCRSRRPGRYANEVVEKIGLADVAARRARSVPTDDMAVLYLLNPTVPTLNLRASP